MAIQPETIANAKGFTFTQTSQPNVYEATEGDTWYNPAIPEVKILNNYQWKYINEGIEINFELLPGGLWAWGDIGGNVFGHTLDKSSPVQVGSLTTWKYVEIGHRYAPIHGIGINNTLWVLGGTDSYGELGVNRISLSSPTRVGSLMNWKLISSGNFTTSAIKIDGTLWSWGDNQYGHLGLTDTISRSSPVQVGSETTWKLISFGLYHQAAIKTDGTLWTWGDNNNGQLGLTDTISRSSPVQVGTLTTWKTLSSGVATLVIKTDGTLWALGAKSSGTYDYSETTNIQTSSPVQVGTLTTWDIISNGVGVVGAIKTDGTLWTWGWNGYSTMVDPYWSASGVLGLTDTIDRSSPTQVGTLTTWKSINFSKYSASAIKTDGTLWAWGRNDYGQLGLINDRISRSSPVQVGTLTTWEKSVHSGEDAFITVAMKNAI